MGSTVVGTRIREGLPAHQSVVDRQTLVELLGPDLAALVPLEGQPSGVQRAQPDGQLGPAVGEVVERGDPTREVPRPDPGQRREHGAQADPGRTHRGGGEGDPGVLTPDRLPREDRVPAGLLGRDREVGELPRRRQADDDAGPERRHAQSLTESAFGRWPVDLR